MTDQKLARDIYQAAHLTGEFTLRSGVTATEYFDKYLFESDPRLLKRIADALAPQVPTDGVDALAGLETGGIPLAVVLAQVTGIPAYFIRKEAKSYGTCRLAEGGDIDGKRLFIVEDVITSGGAVLDALHELRNRGARIDSGVCVIDREAGGLKNLSDNGVDIRALFTMSQLKEAGE
ncbi:orotate phosphoribosyltransferase [Haloglycomyces albus]|uniref:orotate phosphoribosyltransferase n=1 Tax=Haloglycomyces albus TaxID=526067 RepID=UPI00046CD1EC|nr:orotate phosphoribosyltransferase [Haloglycomyces albus]